MGVYGICNYSLDSLYKALKKHSPEINKITDNAVVIITDKDLLLRNLTRVAATIDTTTYFAVGDKDYLKELGVPYADLSKEGEVIKYLSRKLDNCINSEGFVPKVSKDTPQKLLKKTKPSIIKDINTNLYKIQNKKVRSNYRNSVYGLLKTGSFSKVSLILQSKSKNAKKLKHIIESDNFLNLMAAIDKVKHGSSIPKTATEYKISKFDINYVLAFKESE